MKTVTKTIEYRCPMCQVTVPVAVVTASRLSWFKPIVNVTVEGDATDYITHMWAHEQRMT